MPDYTDRVVFQGASPYALPTVQRGEAHGAFGAVTMILYALIDGKGPEPLPITGQMGADVALSLAHSLYDAGHKAKADREH